MRGRGILLQLLRGADRPLDQIPAAVRADQIQRALRAGAAECALEAANECVARFRRQIAIAALTVGTQLEHESTIARVAAAWATKQSGL